MMRSLNNNTAECLKTIRHATDTARFKTRCARSILLVTFLGLCAQAGTNTRIAYNNKKNKSQNNTPSWRITASGYYKMGETVYSLLKLDDNDIGHVTFGMRGEVTGPGAKSEEVTVTFEGLGGVWSLYPTCVTRGFTEEKITFTEKPLGLSWGI